MSYKVIDGVVNHRTVVIREKVGINDLIFGNFAVNSGISTKFCTFCGHGDQSSAKHVHLLLDNRRRDRKASKEWSYAEDLLK